MSGVRPSAFYGPSSGGGGGDDDRRRRRQRKKKRREPCRLINVVKRLLGPPTGWKTFERQQEALDYAAGKAAGGGGGGLMSFAYETSTGRRYFMVAHPETFWYYDARKPADERHTYEIVPDGRPCKLYLDLEFDRRANPASDGARMTDTFVRVVGGFLRRAFGSLSSSSSSSSSSPQQPLLLDSSTAAKFSRHAIFPDAVFADNAHAGRFVRHVCAEIDAFLVEDDGHDDGARFCDGVSAADVLALAVVSADGRPVSFCDLSVYSRNRHFRLYRSSKLNKNVPLVLCDDGPYRPTATATAAHCDDCFDKRIFLESLITHGCDGKVLLNFTNAAAGSSESQTSSSSPSSSLMTVHDDKTECQSSYDRSPFPRVDRFIADLVFPGKIFRIHYFPSVDRLVYSIVKNRYCGNVKRQHKNNNVKYVVDLNEMYWYQKCYDPDCQQYRSDGTKLPEEICFEYARKTVDNLSDSQLVQVADSALLTYEL